MRSTTTPRAAAGRVFNAAHSQRHPVSPKSNLIRGNHQHRRPQCFQSHQPIAWDRPALFAATSEVQSVPSSSLTNRAQPTAVLEGLVCTPGVVNPQAFIDYWNKQTRPRLDALWSSIQRSSNAERVLLASDELLMCLRSSRSLAVHTQQQHEDPLWRAAAAQIAVDCNKYEKYVLGSKALSNKLGALHHRLQVVAASSSCVSSTEQQQQQKLQYLQPHQLLPLCRVLLASLKDQLPQDSLSWLAALEVPDPNAVLLKQLQQQEQELIAAVDAVVSKPVLVMLPQSVDALLQADQNSAHTQAHVNSACPPTPDEIPAQAHVLASSLAGIASGGSGCSQAVFVTRSLLVQLLQRCSDSSVRQQVYMEVLQPKLAEAAALLDKLARCRQQQAHLTSHSSYLELTQQRLTGGSSTCSDSNVNQSISSDVSPHCAAGAADNQRNNSPVDLLLQLSAALQPLAQQEVAEVLHQQQLNGLQQPGIHSIDPVLNGLQQQQQQAYEGRLPQQSGQGQEQVSCNPWDWDYLLHRAQQRHCTPLEDAALQDYLHLDSVIGGFSEVLQQLLGVQLILRPAGPAEVWGAHVRAVMVFSSPASATLGSQGSQQQQQQQGCATSHQQDCPADAVHKEFLGTIYLDVGAGYGCRMLRYARSQTSSRSSSGITGAPAAIDELQLQWSVGPAVAVGVSGTRLMSPASGQQAHDKQQCVLRHPLSQNRPEVDEADPLQSVESSDLSSSSSSTSCVSAALCLSLAQLWELGHELGHALHLILSSRQPACHLSGRFIPPSLLEVPSQLIERLLTRPSVLMQLCRHHQAQQPLPADMAAALAAHYGCKYNSGLAVLGRVAAGLAEQMYGHFGGDGDNYWRGSWEAVSGLPREVASHGCLKELSLLPVLAAHHGSYHCYLTSWLIAAKLCERLTLKPLATDKSCASKLSMLQQNGFHLPVFEDLNAASWRCIVNDLAEDHYGATPRSIEDVLLPHGALDAHEVIGWVWRRHVLQEPSS